MRDFIDKDRDYVDWLAANPEGYVINSYRQPTRSYLMLHRAGCRTITGQPSAGNSWTTDYRKVCGTRDELEQWARAAVGGSPTRCGTCLG